MKFVISLVVLALAAAVTANPVDNTEVKEAAVQGAGEAGKGYFSAQTSWASGLAAVQDSIEDMGQAATDLGVIESQLETLSLASGTVATGESTIETAVDKTGLDFINSHTT